MGIHQYSQEARRRIAAAVRWVEARPRDALTTVPTPARTIKHKLVRAQADIEHGQVGQVKHLSGVAFGQSVDLLSNDTAFKVYNPGHKVWSGADCIVAPIGLPGQDQTNQAGWYIVKAWSATRIRGKTTGAITHGQTGTIDNITTIDGTVSFASTSVYLPTDVKDVTANLLVWAELVFRTSTNTSRWEIYSGDCPGT